MERVRLTWSRAKAAIRARLQRVAWWAASVRTRILLLAVLAALLPASVMILHLLQALETDEIEARRQLGALARSSAAELQARMAGSIQLLVGLSQARALDSGDVEACSAFLEQVAKANPRYTAIVTLLPDGELHCNSRRSGNRRNVAETSYFQRAVASTGPILLPAIGPVTGSGVVLVSLAVRDARGAVRFVLVAVLNLDLFAREGAAGLPYTAAVLSIFDRDGRLMALQPPDPGRVLETGASYADSPLFEFIRGADSGATAELPGLLGQKRIWGVGKLPGAPEPGVSVAIGVSSKRLFEEGRSRIRAALAGVALASLLAFIGAVALSEFGLRRHFIRIRDAVHRFRGGDLTARVGKPYAGGEIGDLMLALDLTAEGIEKQQNAIARQARRQTLIAAFGRQALASRQLDELYAQAVRLASDALDAELCRVLEVSAESGSAVIRAGVGWEEGWIGRAFADPRPMLYRDVLTKGAPVFVYDFHAERLSTGRGPLSVHGVTSGVEVPIAGLDGAYGVLGAFSRRRRRFTEDDGAFLQNLANILEAAIERQRAEEKVARLAQFDALTGLPNRVLFRDRLVQALIHAQRSQARLGVLFIDLDGFKAVNDTRGHNLGDRLLTLVAGRLQACLRSGDTIARLGGDEFAVVLSELARAEDAGLVAQKMVAALVRPFDLEGEDAYVSASIGIAVCPDDGEDPDVLVKNADIAMYQAKEQGRNRSQFYLPAMNQRALERRQLETQLRRALERGEFRLHYQPKADLETGELCGFEALLRWAHPEQGMVLPGRFIPILEETGLIVPVGEWVLRTACRQIREWEQLGVTPVPVAVNLSARQFQQKHLDASIENILREAGADPRLLELELTESLLMVDPEEARVILHRLKGHGVRLAIDDFGTGYSSLAYLKRFPLDILKIDRAFIRDCVYDPEDAAIAATIIDLAHSLRLQVVAEGVEDSTQLAFLRAHGCDQIQGYFLARPLDAGAATQALLAPLRLAG